MGSERRGMDPAPASGERKSLKDVDPGSPRAPRRGTPSAAPIPARGPMDPERQGLKLLVPPCSGVEDAHLSPGGATSTSGALILFEGFSVKSLISDLCTYKWPRFDDLTNFSGDNPPPCSQDFTDFFESEYGLQILLLAATVWTAGSGADLATRSTWAPYHRLLPHAQHLSSIKNDLKVLQRLFDGLNRNVIDLEESSFQRFDECLAGIKSLSSRNEGTLQQVLKAIEEARTKNDEAVQLAFEKLSAQLKRMEKKEISPALNKLDELIKTAEIPILLKKRLETMHEELVSTLSYAVRISTFLSLYYIKVKPEKNGKDCMKNEVADTVKVDQDRMKNELADTVKVDQAQVEVPELVAAKEEAPCLYSPIMNAGLFKGIGRKSKVLLQKGFGESFGKINLPLNSSQNYASSLTATTKQEVGLKLSYNDVPGHKLMTVLSLNQPKSFKAKLQCTLPYIGLNGSFKSDQGSHQEKTQLLKLAVATSKGPYRVGGKVTFESGKVKDYQYGIGASFLGRFFAVKMLNGGAVKASFHDQITKSTATAMEVKYTLSDKNLELAAGVEYLVDSNTKLKATFDSTGYCGVLVEHLTGSSSFFSLATKFKLNHLGEGPRFGFCYGVKPERGVNQIAPVNGGVIVNSKCEIQGPGISGPVRKESVEPKSGADQIAIVNGGVIVNSKCEIQGQGVSGPVGKGSGRP